LGNNRFKTPILMSAFRLEEGK